jgi:long-chain acyl-CoA synthetase
LRSEGIALEPIVFDAPAEDPNSLSAVIAHGRGMLGAQPAALMPDDLAVVIYTSGTTGSPKGVMLSHRNLASNAHGAFDLISDLIRPGDPVLSILPYAHIYESTNVFGYFIRGAEIYVNRQIETLLDDLRAVRPVIVFCVPRIFERTFAGILAKARAGGGLKAKFVPWALAIGRRYKAAELAGTARAVSGCACSTCSPGNSSCASCGPQLGCDRLRVFVSGSASLHLDIALTFEAAGMPIMEGYGLTECSPVVTVNRPGAWRVGTVGRPIPGVEVRLAEDGEILVRGPNVMQGYFRNPAATAARMHDGWLATGDVGTLDPDGYLRIIDRKDEIFKTSGGKFISPARVETAVMRSPFIAQAVVFGNGMPHPAALISPNWTALCSRMEIPSGTPPAELVGREDVRRFVAAECTRKTADLATFGQIRWTGVLVRDLTIEHGELTPTLKLKRRVIEARYASLVDTST